NDVKITMLGTTGAGKTCYMLGLYAVMQMGLQGFTLSAKDPDVDLKLTDLWERLIDTTGEDRWPPPTPDDPQTYAFNFSYGLKPLIAFDWMDYRGGAMTDSSTASDARQLRERLKASDCVFLCISGEHLKEHLSDAQLGNKARKAKVNNMTTFLVELGDIIKPSDQKPFPIVITITKYDLCFGRPKQELMADIKKIFGPLFTPGSGWLVMICPVSLGKELGEDSASGHIDPKNMHLPLVFALYSRFREYFLSEQNQLSGTRERLANLKGGNWLQRWWKSGDIQATEVNIQASQSKINEIQQRMALLAQELTNAELYLSGEEIKIDV
ncbi:MAG: hypothetical protein SAK29_08320, partial [Scytonema sp. PMC 1069.18]|nr:hypothetical protein [Scytonema sp. PMC 1069.18]